MSANERQVGGSHYLSDGYQLWDYGMDVEPHPLVYVALRYIIRHKKKNGDGDITKAIHYCDKLIESKFSTNCNETRITHIVWLVESYGLDYRTAYIVSLLCLATDHFHIYHVRDELLTYLEDNKT